MNFNGFYIFYKRNIPSLSHKMEVPLSPILDIKDPLIKDPMIAPSNKLLDKIPIEY